MSTGIGTLCRSLRTWKFIELAYLYYNQQARLKIMMLNKKSERLYLSKGDENIYVDICELSQHQIDGIRFLYKQFKKKTQGIIINDPSGYGKTLQVVLFLNAIHSLLDKPVLILCDELETQNWMKHFRRWTQLCDKVKIESSNPYLKNVTICINGMMNLASFSMKDWSIVVVDDKIPRKSILKVGFKADCKIWITSVDMKTNLETFSQIYNWLYPEEKMNPKDFVANKSFKDIIAKAILIDGFMEDIVLRRYDSITPFTTKPEAPKIIEQNVKMKNKDSTGTKIKCSKRKCSANSSIIEDMRQQTNTDIETFIRDQKPVGSDALEKINMQIFDISQSNSGNVDSSIASTVNNDINVKRKRNSNEETVLVDVNEKSNGDKNTSAVTKCHKPKELYLSKQSDMLLEELVYEDSDQKSMESDTSDVVVSKNDIDFNISNINKIESSEVKVVDTKEPKADSSNSNVAGIDAVVDVDPEPVKGKKTIDELMTEMENKILKKFKGSFLDKIF